MKKSVSLLVLLMVIVATGTALWSQTETTTDDLLKRKQISFLKFKSEMAKQGCKKMIEHRPMKGGYPMYAEYRCLDTFSSWRP